MDSSDYRHSSESALKHSEQPNNLASNLLSSCMLWLGASTPTARAGPCDKPSRPDSLLRGPFSQRLQVHATAPAQVHVTASCPVKRRTRPASSHSLPFSNCCQKILSYLQSLGLRSQNRPTAVDVPRPYACLTASLQQISGSPGGKFRLPPPSRPGEVGEGGGAYSTLLMCAV